MKKIMRTLTLTGLAGSVLVVSNLALADTPATGTTSAPSTPAFHALPSGNMTAPPKDKAPARVPKTEHVDGFAVADPPKTQIRDGKVTNVIIFASDNDAKDYNAGKAGAFSGRSSADSTCFARRSNRNFFGEEEGTEWAFDMEPTTRITAPWKQPPMPPPLPKGQKPPAVKAQSKQQEPTRGEMEVTAVHQERFLTEGGKARVEMTDVWVDPVTHGVRLLAKTTLPLERIGVSQGGVTLYAARGDKQLHVVARREKATEAPDHPPTTSHDFRMQNLNRMPLMVHKSDGQNDATQCGFAHISLKTSKGMAEMASFETQAVFIDPPDPNAKKDDTDEQLKGLVQRQPQEDEPEVRLRPLRATVSSTWSSRDKEPIISVSYGWAGRERQM